MPQRAYDDDHHDDDDDDVCTEVRLGVRAALATKADAARTPAAPLRLLWRPRRLTHACTRTATTLIDRSAGTAAAVRCPSASAAGGLG
eukprot:scaffold7848_cov484-Prasinococcus_capsulatus_cf.AAC.4